MVKAFDSKAERERGTTRDEDGGGGRRKRWLRHVTGDAGRSKRRQVPEGEGEKGP